jgi:glycine/D-amino acid oxidase-like deaminating enzyme
MGRGRCRGLRLLVVGAGVSGAVAATGVQLPGHEVVVLDARELCSLTGKVWLELSDHFSLGTAVPDLIFGGRRLDRNAARELVGELGAAVRRVPPRRCETVAQWLRRARLSEQAESLLAAIARSTPASPLRFADARELNPDLTWGEGNGKIKGGNDLLPRSTEREVDVRLDCPVRVIGWTASGVTVREAVLYRPRARLHPGADCP